MANVIPVVTVLAASLIGLSAAQSQCTYMAAVPRSMYSGRTLLVPVLFPTTVTKQTVTARLTQRDVEVAQASMSVSGVTSLTLTLQVPDDINFGSHQLTVEGSGDVIFENETYIYGRMSSDIIFIQTDKAIYKPGETVRYRVFTVNNSLDLQSPMLDIEIFDPKKNKIYEKNNVQNLLGTDGELPLSDMPVLGYWEVMVTSKTDKKIQKSLSFQVQEYVLPKFEVIVELPGFGTVSDETLKVKVTAKYTHGQPVSGNMVLTISKRYPYGFFDPRAIRTELPINGETTFDVPTDVLKRLTRNLEYESLRVHINMTEAITGITLGGERTIRYYDQPYKLEFHPNMPDNFKPGLGDYEVMVKVTLQDGRPPVLSKKNKLFLTVTYFTETPLERAIKDTVPPDNYTIVAPFLEGDTISMETIALKIQDDGTAQKVIKIPAEASTGLIRADFKGLKVYKEIRRFRSPSETYLKAESVEKGPFKIGDTMHVKLTSSEKPVLVKYLVISKSRIVDTGEITIPEQSRRRRKKKTSDQVDIIITRDMIPSARIVAYFIKESNGEIVADGFNFVIEDMFENKVTIEFGNSSQPVEPKSPTELRVTADPGSLVNALAVDKSVLLLGGDKNDITPSRVKDMIGNGGIFFRGWGFFPWSFSADDASDIFQTADLNVLTDGHLYRFNLWELDQPRVSGGFGGAVPMEDGIAMAAGVAKSEPQGQIRRDFPETWIWNSKTASDGNVFFRDTAPDTITEWVANAFALHPDTGLGVAPVKSNITVFLPFFVTVQLPYSVVRGETAVIQAIVFNYHPEDLYVTVELKNNANNPEFVGITVDSSGTETEVTGSLTKCILAKSGTPTPVFFNVRPTIIGTMTVNVRITNESPRNIFDEIFRTLIVKAEGVTKRVNTPVLISLQTTGSYQESVEITYPPSLVQDSAKIRVTAFGDIFGISMDNIGRLVRLPTGCGEQNMVTFAPLVYAGNYLLATGRPLLPNVERFINTGYQRQMLYQRNDGSFSAFGNADSSGSLWLTAFVIQSFTAAKPIQAIDINKGLRYVLRQQNTVGSFNNTGIVFHKAMQGGTASNVNALTAFILVALKEIQIAGIVTDVELVDQLGAAVNLALEFLNSQLGEMNTDYEAAIGAYALKLAESDYTTLLAKLESSENKTAEGNQVYWKNPSRALQIEIAAYALMTYIDEAGKDKGLQVLNWLVKQRSSSGGFYSTQDTVVGLKALALFAEFIYTKNVNLDVDVYAMKGVNQVNKRTLQITSDNHDILQYVDYDGDVDSIEVEAMGTGLAIVDVEQIFNVITEPEPPSYVLTLETSKEKKTSYLLKACAQFNIRGSGSNMAILDIGAVSGFEPVKGEVKLLGGGADLMKRIDLIAERLIIYFDEIPDYDVCVEVPMQKVSVVANVKPASVIVYSYYEPLEREMAQYLPKIFQTSGLCDVCGAECGCGDLPELPMSQCSGSRLNRRY